MTIVGRAARGIASAGLVLALLPLPGCAPDARPRPANRVRAILAADPTSLSLIGKTDRNSELVASLIGEGLVRYDATLTLRPRVARSWESSADGLTWTFHLREGVRWHDGAPVTAADVVFTIEKVRDPATQASSYAASFDDLDSIVALDDRTVRAVYRRPYADTLASFTLPLVPRHLAAADKDFLTGEFARHPTGCGAFRFVRAISGQEIVLAAYDDYWDGRPAIDEIVFRILRDDRTVYQAVQRGDIDVLAAPPDLWLALQESRESGRLAAFISWPLAAWYVGWNQDGSNEFFADPRTRRAMVLSLDRKRFISTVMADLAIPAVGSFHPASGWSDPSIEPWPFDPAEAGRLLDEAGWTDRDGDGIRERNGKPLAFELLIPASAQELTDRMAAWMQDSLRETGVGVRITKLEWRAFQQRRLEHRFEAAMAAMGLPPTPDRYEIYHSAARENGLNYAGVNDGELDRLLEEGRRTLDPAARREVYVRLQRRLHETEPISCLFHIASPIVHHPRLEGLAPSPIGIWLTTPGPRAWHWAGVASGN